MFQPRICNYEKKINSIFLQNYSIRNLALQNLSRFILTICPEPALSWELSKTSRISLKISKNSKMAPINSEKRNLYGDFKNFISRFFEQTEIPHSVQTTFQIRSTFDRTLFLMVFFRLIHVPCYIYTVHTKKYNVKRPWAREVNVKRWTYAVPISKYVHEPTLPAAALGITKFNSTAQTGRTTLFFLVCYVLIIVNRHSNRLYLIGGCLRILLGCG